MIEPIASSIKQTQPGTSFPTVSGKTINNLSWGVATLSLDNKLEYIHVLKAPKGKILILPVPEDGKLFGSASLLRNGKKVTLKQTGKGVELTLSEDEDWDPFNTVIQLTVSGMIPVKSKSCWINDTEFDISYEGRGWDYSRWERKHGDYDNDVHVTAVKGDALLFPFTGTGIEYIGSLSSDQGKCDIFLDGIFQTTVDGFAAGLPGTKSTFQ